MSEQPSRYTRSFNGMIGALLILLLVIGGYVAFRAVTRTDVEVRPQQVDYLETVGYAQQGGLEVVYPASLPKGWTSTGVDLADRKKFGWGIRFLTADGSFAGVRQSEGDLEDLLHTYIDEDPEEGASIESTSSIASTWQTWTDTGGDTAYVAERDGQWVMVYGSASAQDLQALTDALSVAPLTR